MTSPTRRTMAPAVALALLLLGATASAENVSWTLYGDNESASAVDIVHNAPVVCASSPPLLSASSRSISHVIVVLACVCDGRWCPASVSRIDCDRLSALTAMSAIPSLST